MVSRRQFLLGASGVAAGALVLPGFAATGWAQDPVPPPGRQQSPIDIVTSRVVSPPNFPPLVIDYPTRVNGRLEYISRDTAPAGCSVREENETVQASGFSRPATVRVGRDTYNLVQFHFHTRSEHTVDGRYFVIEQHFVHERVGDGARMVIGVFLTRGGAAPQDRALATLPAECGPPVALTDIDLRGMLPRDLASYNYPGSLTTPPYTEGVRWQVMRTPVRIADRTVNRYRMLFPDGDSRELQPLNGRTVRLTPGRLA